jgi:hypothetical protein
MSDQEIIVTGDRCHDRYIFKIGDNDKPPNFLEAWEEANQHWNIRIPGGAGGLIEYINACKDIPLTAQDPFEDENLKLAESIYILTRQWTTQERKRAEARDDLSKNQKLAEQKWRMGQYVIPGEQRVPCYPVSQLGYEYSDKPLVLIDYNQGFREENLKNNNGNLSTLFEKRKYLIRSHDPRTEDWREFRRSVLKDGAPDRIWYSPLQDLNRGGLKFSGNWKDVCDRVERYLKDDDTLWKDQEGWKHTIVILLWYDGALIFKKGSEKGERILKIFAGDQPESFMMKGYGAVLGGGLVFAAFLAQALLETDKIEEYVEKGLKGLRAQWDTGYDGPRPDDNGNWPSERNFVRETLLATSWPFEYDIVNYNFQAPKKDFEYATKLVTANELDFKRLTAFTLGKLVTCEPDEARSLLQLRSRISDHVESDSKEILSFAILGKPGAGKSFIARQLKEGIDPEGNKLEEVERNLSQFDALERLVDTFQEIQAVTLRGKIPFVLWDEFDTSFNKQQGGWWQYFLMPMQDAKFQNGKLQEELGKCIFAFIGGIYHDNETFIKEAVKSPEGVLAKGPDFHSRLSSIVQAESVDMNSESYSDPNAEHPAKLVRALVIRRLLQDISEKARPTDIKSISEDLLAYLIHTPLRHGVRSLRQIIKASEFKRSENLAVYNLPSRDVLCLHVDGKTADDNPVKDFLSQPSFRCLSKNVRRLKLEWNDK